jgi:hypothetical protein
MNFRTSGLIRLACLSLAGTCIADGTYTLGSDSQLDDGCRPPCMCPFFFAGRIEGRFELTLVDRGPLFDTYALTDIDWTVPQLGVTLHGRGEYRIGGEVFLGQYLTLDLVGSNGREYHLESGDPRGADAFPDIRINADDQVDQACSYTEIFLRSSPFCIADFNDDGGVDGGDVESFFLAWEAGLPAADVNRDGGTDGADVEFFFRLWENGGCG